MALSTETQILFGMIVFISFLGFMDSFLPPQFAVMSPFSIFSLSASMVGVVAVCATTLFGSSACGAAIAVFSMLNIVVAIVTSSTWVGDLITIPITFMIIYITSRLAQGGG